MKTRKYRFRNRKKMGKRGIFKANPFRRLGKSLRHKAGRHGGFFKNQKVYVSRGGIRL